MLALILLRFGNLDRPRPTSTGSGLSTSTGTSTGGGVSVGVSVGVAKRSFRTLGEPVPGRPPGAFVVALDLPPTGQPTSGIARLVRRRMRLGARMYAFAVEWLHTPLHRIVYNPANVAPGLASRARR